MLTQLRPGFGKSKLVNIDKSKLPELNENYGSVYFKRLRKDLYGEAFNQHRGISSVIRPPHSVHRVQRNFCPKNLFVSEWDVVYPPEPVDPPEEEGKKKKKKKKEEEVKMYPHHKMSYAAVGKLGKRDGTNSIFKGVDTSEF